MRNILKFFFLNIKTNLYLSALFILFTFSYLILGLKKEIKELQLTIRNLEKHTLELEADRNKILNQLQELIKENTKISEISKPQNVPQEFSSSFFNNVDWFFTTTDIRVGITLFMGTTSLFLYFYKYWDLLVPLFPRKTKVKFLDEPEVFYLDNNSDSDSNASSSGSNSPSTNPSIFESTDFSSAAPNSRLTTFNVNLCNTQKSNTTADVSSVNNMPINISTNMPASITRNNIEYTQMPLSQPAEDELSKAVSYLENIQDIIDSIN